MTFYSKYRLTGLLVGLFFILNVLTHAQPPKSGIEQYNVVWTSQSKDSSESMPVGGGDTGCNVWVENGDILFYISRTGTFDENNSMLKLGRVRVRLSPSPFNDGESFRQELKLREGYVEITGKNTKVKLWVEVFNPVIHLEIESDQMLEAEAIYETWRTEDHSLSLRERDQCLSFMQTDPRHITLFTRKDSFKEGNQRFIWYHRNRNDDLVFDKEVTQQHLDSIKGKLWNPLKDSIFGGLIQGRNMVFEKTINGSYLGTDYKGWILKSPKPAKKHSVNIVLHSSYGKSADAWIKEINIKASKSSPDKIKWEKNLAWWNKYWNRSHIYINPGKGTTDNKGWEIGRNYQVFRYQLGCNAYGEYPTKFNGSLFCYDPHLVSDSYRGRATPDFRRWGGGSFTAQNQRLVYWPMLKSGDFDMMRPQFEFYRRALNNAELRTQLYWGHKGASFTEQIENYGLPIGDIYHRLWGGSGVVPRSDADSTRVLKNRYGEEVKVLDYGYLNNRWVTDQYDTAIEFGLMILDYQKFTGADISQYIPFIESCIRFHDEHYQYWSKKLNGSPLDKNGKLVMYPSTALETYKIALNSTNTIAAMQTVLSRLLALPASYGTPSQRTYWKTVLDRLPEITYREKEGKKVISPANNWEYITNVELPQLYPVYPYGLFGVGKENLQVAIDTWHHGADRPDQYNFTSWHQDAIFCARLGLTEEAKNITIQKLSNANRRFPTFWGPGHDWVPDHNWGGSGMIGLQEMLMQTDGKKIYLFPAWPKDWDVDFKLHAPFNTIVEGRMSGGKVVNLQVIPESRKKDIVNLMSIPIM